MTLVHALAALVETLADVVRTKLDDSEMHAVIADILRDTGYLDLWRMISSTTRVILILRR